MHNGGMLTRDQVVEFYTRGGDFHEANAANLDARIAGVGRLVGSPTNRANVVAFLKTLTDDRVRFESAPFDHPQLFIPNGHPGDAAAVVNDGTGKATDALVEVPASGAAGSCVGVDGTPHFACPVCGDKKVNQASEQCDGADSARCPGRCRADCTCPAACRADGTGPPCPRPPSGAPVGTVEADTLVNKASPAKNNGTSARLEVDASPAKHAFFRVRVSGVGARQVTSARLRLQVSNVSHSQSVAGGRIHSVPNCARDESTVTAKTQPAIAAPAPPTLGAVP